MGVDVAVDGVSMRAGREEISGVTGTMSPGFFAGATSVRDGDGVDGVHVTGAGFEAGLSVGLNHCSSGRGGAIGFVGILAEGRLIRGIGGMVPDETSDWTGVRGAADDGGSTRRAVCSNGAVVFGTGEGAVDSAGLDGDGLAGAAVGGTAGTTAAPGAIEGSGGDGAPRCIDESRIGWGAAAEVVGVGVVVIATGVVITSGAGVCVGGLRFVVLVTATVAGVPDMVTAARGAGL